MKNFVKTTGILSLAAMLLFSCSKDDSEGMVMEEQSYNTTFKITDAPIDNANVEAVFVTITDVKVDGTSIDGFTKTTLELSSLIDGQTAILGNLGLQAGAYANLVLEMDYEKDAQGVSPGCYVHLVDGTKDKLVAAANSISVNDAFNVAANASNEIVIDFDLRKTIKEEQNGVSADFEFVSMSELSAGVRAVNEEASGMISGTASDVQNTSDKIIVFAYKKGTFNAEVETQGQGESNITFAKAVTSSSVNNFDGSYSLSFLDEGEYELIFASYNEQEDKFFFNALLEAESTTGINLEAIQISSDIQISANVTITGTKS